jgi:hypothetical protein
MDFNFNNIILYFIIPIWLILEIFIIKWMFDAKPDRKSTSKYSKKVIFLSQLPLGSRWKKGVNKDDIKIFEKYQYRIKIWYFSVLIFFCLFIAYLYIAF